MLIKSCSVELVGVGEPLRPRTFPHRNQSRLLGVKDSTLGENNIECLLVVCIVKHTYSDLTNASMMIIHLCAIWSWICQGGSEITIIVESPVLASMLVVEMAGGRN